MAKKFNVAADCKSGEHYMVCLDKRLAQIKEMVDDGKYFTINRARQYGKTTTLRFLSRYLQEEYYVVSMDFQTFGNAKFKSEHVFSVSFASSFLRLLERNKLQMPERLQGSIAALKKRIEDEGESFELKELFEELSDICAASDRLVVLMVDEVDSAADNQVFFDFLAQLRAYYIDRDIQPSFQSVILAGVYDIKNLKRRIRHKINSPWNIAADFKIDMSFSKEEIAGMLVEYEADHHTGMDVEEMAGQLYAYTSGYPFLVSRLCKLMDEDIRETDSSALRSGAWTRDGLYEAVRMLLEEKNTLFDSLAGKLRDYPELNEMLRTLLFTGKSIVYNPDDPVIDMASMFGFIRSKDKNVAITNRIFETRLYNLYLSTAEIQKQEMYRVSLQDRSQFIADGHLNMRRVLERFVVHFNDLYHDCGETFVEEEKMTNLLEKMQTRRSIRKFKPDMVPKEILDEIITAGTYAATGMNTQSPIIIAVTNKEMRDKLSDMNARVMGTKSDPFYGAPVILIVLADKSCVNRVYDGSLVMGNLMLAAHELGIGSCWIHRAKEEFETEEGLEILKSLGITGEYEGIGHCALGYVDGEYPGIPDRKENWVYYIE